MMVDFKDNSARIDNSTQAIACTFDDDTETVMAGLLQKWVYAVGISTRRRDNTALVEFHIKLLFIMLAETPTDDMLAALAAYRAENDTRENLRRALLDVKQGRTYPISTLWDDIDAE